MYNCIAFHLLQTSEFHPKLGVLWSFIFSHILVLPKIMGTSRLVLAVCLCSYVRLLTNQFRYEEPQLPCAAKIHMKS